MLLALALCFAGGPARAEAGLGIVAAWGPVVVKGRDLPADYRVAVREVGLFRMGKGGWEAVPFQVDERDEKGDFALPDGPEPSRDESPGVLDDNDELVFAAEDLGLRAHGVDAAEIHVSDPLSNSDGWLYLRLGAGARASAPDAVRYDPMSDTVYARRYVLGFGRHTTKRFSFVRADGTPGPNLLDRVKARIRVKLLGGLLGFLRTEQDITSTVMAWKDGPIRAIRRTRLRAHIGYGLPSPEVISEYLFTGDTFDAPATVHIPFDVRYVFGSLSLTTYMDFAGVSDLRIFTINRDPTPIACGQPLPPVDGVRASWFGMTGPEGTFVQVLRMSKDLATVKRQIYAVADARPDPPERLPGDCPGVGYTLSHWGGIGRGSYWSDTVVRAFDHYSAGDVQVFLYSVANPLRVSVGRAPK